MTLYSFFMLKCLVGVLGFLVVLFVVALKQRNKKRVRTWDAMVEDGPGYGYIKTPQGSFGWGTRVRVTAEEIAD